MFPHPISRETSLCSLPKELDLWQSTMCSTLIIKFPGNAGLGHSPVPEARDGYLFNPRNTCFSSSLLPVRQTKARSRSSIWFQNRSQRKFILYSKHIANLHFSLILFPFETLWVISLTCAALSQSQASAGRQALTQDWFESDLSRDNWVT